MADQVMSMKEPEIQRKCSNCEEEDNYTLYRKKISDYKSTSFQASYFDTAPMVPEIVNATGKSIDHNTKRDMEERFGYDFSLVRVHTDEKAAKSAEMLSASAYTVGKHIVFGKGQYQASTLAGRRLLAHELTHVVQQSGLSSTSKGLSSSGLRASKSSSHSDRDNACSSFTPLKLQKPSDTVLQRESSSGLAYNINLIYPPDQIERHKGISSFEALRTLRRFANKIEAHIVGGEAGHEHLIRLHVDQYIVSAISDLFGDVSLPPYSIWNAPREQLRRAHQTIEQGDIESAAKELQIAAKSAQEAERKVYEYREGTITGAERTVFGLEIVKVASATAVTIGTGGTAGVFVGAGYAGLQRLAGEAEGVRVGLQNNIDWSGIAFDTFISIILGKYGSKLGGAIASRLGPLLVAKFGASAAAQLGSHVTAEAVSALIVGRAASIVHAAARELFDSLRGRTELSWENFINRLAEQQTLKAVLTDLLIGGVGGAATYKKPPTGTSEIKQLKLLHGGDTKPVPMRTNSQGQRVVASGQKFSQAPPTSTPKPTVKGNLAVKAPQPVPDTLVVPRPALKVVPDVTPVPVAASIPQSKGSQNTKKSPSFPSAAAAINAVHSSAGTVKKKDSNSQEAAYPLCWPTLLHFPTQSTFTRVKSPDRDYTGENQKALKHKRQRELGDPDFRSEDYHIHHVVPLFLGGGDKLQSPSQGGNGIILPAEQHLWGHRLLQNQPQMLNPPKPLQPLPADIYKHPIGTKYKLVGFKSSTEETC